MTNLLKDEAPQMYHPTLAAWIGLNEAIFLSQLHFILTRKNSVGKFADGRRWYRDKPRDFVVSYFPFWDEGIVKRVIDNLRADGILLARSDLNTRPKDRSLSYSINYSVLERLDGPVERILNKSEKRKKARAARKSREDNQGDYTKVQNVPLSENPTECTSDLGTKCTEGQVQNVPTPKDSILKTPSLPNGKLADAGARPKTQIKDKFLELTNLTMPNLKRDQGFWWSQFGEILQLARNNPGLACEWMTDAIDYMRVSGLTITGPQSILGMIRALASGQSLTKGRTTNGTYQRHSNGTKFETGEHLDNEPTFDPYTGREIPAGGA